MVASEGAFRTCEAGILPEDIGDGGPKHQEDIDDAALGHPADVSLWGLPGALQVVHHLPKQGLWREPGISSTPGP